YPVTSPWVLRYLATWQPRQRGLGDPHGWGRAIDTPRAPASHRARRYHIGMLGLPPSGDPMLDVTLRRAVAAALVALGPLAACTSAVSTPATPIVTASTTLLTRLGADTIAMEQYTRTPTRMEGVLVQRAPFTTIARYS